MRIGYLFTLLLLIYSSSLRADDGYVQTSDMYVAGGMRVANARLAWDLALGQVVVFKRGNGYV